MMLQSIMSAGARERLARVAMVKPEQARAVENHLLTQARSGKLKTQVGGRRGVKGRIGVAGGAEKGAPRMAGVQALKDERGSGGAAGLVGKRSAQGGKDNMQARAPAGHGRVPPRCCGASSA